MASDIHDLSNTHELEAIPRARFLKTPEEMTDLERARWDLVRGLRQGSPSVATLRNNWWGDQIPYDCDRPWVQHLGSQYYLQFDAWNWRYPTIPPTYPDFWSCWVPAFNAEAPGYDQVGWGFLPVDSVEVGNEWIVTEVAPDGTSILHPSVNLLVLQWGLFRGDTLLGYCSGNPYQCGHGPYYINDGYFTCEESLVVTLWDNRWPPQGEEYLFGYEITEDVPWDEYDQCSS